MTDRKRLYRTLGRPYMLWGIILALLLSGATASAQTTAEPGTPEVKARLEIKAGQAALLANKSTAAAIQHFSRAYRQAPLPDIFVYLGQAAQQEGRAVDALDYYRRYLDTVAAQPGTTPDPHIVQQVEALQREIHSPYAIVTIRSQDLPDALLYVDKRVVGRLPLPGPLHLSGCSHTFSVEQETGTRTAQPRLFPAARVVVTLEPGRRPHDLLVHSTALPELAWILHAGNAPEVVLRAMDKAVQDELREPNISVELAPTRIVTQFTPATAPNCLPPVKQEIVGCQYSTARFLIRLDVQMTGIVDPQNTPAKYKIMGQVYDLRLGMLGAQGEADCSPCSLTEAARRAGKLAYDLEYDTNNRERGELIATSSPSKAQIFIDGCLRGQTPESGMELFKGAQGVTIRRKNYAPYIETISVTTAKPVVIHAQLIRTGQPLWRLVTGSILVGSGLLVGGFGISALTQYGRLYDETRDPTGIVTYDTKDVGGGLTGSGAALALTGALLLAIPAR